MKNSNTIEITVDKYNLISIANNNIITYEIPWPGYKPSDVNINFENSFLNIIGQRTDITGRKIIRKFTEYLKKTEYVTASWNNGMLNLNIINKEQ